MVNEEILGGCSSPTNLIQIKVCSGFRLSNNRRWPRASTRGRVGREGSMADAPSRWPQFARALRKQALMDEMMKAQGVDVLAAVKTGEAFVQARANCRDCDCEGACRESASSDP